MQVVQFWGTGRNVLTFLVSKKYLILPPTSAKYAISDTVCIVPRLFNN